MTALAETTGLQTALARPFANAASPAAKPTRRIDYLRRSVTEMNAARGTTPLTEIVVGRNGRARLSLPRHFSRVCLQEDSTMILIEGIPVLAARLGAEQKAKEWLAKTRRSASDTTQRDSVDRRSAAIKRSAKAA